jgi:pimeloyl-ACP methyl ester carboxylesterase
MGGLVTQALAVKYPQDVQAAIIANVNHAQTKESFAALMGRAEDARRDGIASILDVTMARWFNEPFRRRGGDAPVRARLLANDIRGWCDAFTAMANVDTAPKLKSLQMPVLCLAGGDDRSTPPPVVKAMADAIPGARYAELANGPHMMFFELPQETAEIVGPFFRETLRGVTTSP